MQPTNVIVDVMLFSTMASSHETNPCTVLPDEHWSLGARPDREAATMNVSSTYDNDYQSDVLDRMDSVVSASFRHGDGSVALTPASTWSISPIKSSVRHSVALKSAYHDFPSQELNCRYEAPELLPPTPPTSGIFTDIDSYHQLKLFDISPDIGNQGKMRADDRPFISQQTQKISATHCNGQLDQFATASFQNTASTPERKWTISPIKSSRRNFKGSLENSNDHTKTKRSSYPSQEPIHQYDAFPWSSPNCDVSANLPPLPPLPPINDDLPLHIEECGSMAVSSVSDLPKVTSVLASKPTQDLSIGGKCNSAAATAESVAHENEFREEKSKSKRAMFYSNRRKKPKTTATGAIVPSSLDILRGRGGLTNRWAGNLRFREEARKLRTTYRSERTTHDDKFLITWDLVNRVDEYGGRFLQMGPDKQWYEMSDQDARKKASQGKKLGDVDGIITLPEPWIITRLYLSQYFARRNGIRHVADSSQIIFSVQDARRIYGSCDRYCIK